MNIIQHGPCCDVCGKPILPIGDEMVYYFSEMLSTGLIADNACAEIVRAAYKAKDWKMLPVGPLRSAWEKQETLAALDGDKR